jgi:VanZ family protein
LGSFLKHTRWSVWWAAFIILLTIIPGSFLPVLPRLIDLFSPDKLVHVAVYAVFLVLAARDFDQQRQWNRLQRNAMPAALIAAVALGALTELLQKFFIPMRLGSWIDFIANLAGCALGWIFYQYYVGRKRPAKQD